MRNYPACLEWSDDDQAWIARNPMLPGCMAHGETRESAMINWFFAVESWLRTAKQLGRRIP